MKKMMNREETITVDLLRWSTDEEAQKASDRIQGEGVYFASPRSEIPVDFFMADFQTACTEPRKRRAQ